MPILGFKLPARVASRPRGTKGRSGRTGRGSGRSSGKKGGNRTRRRNNYGPRPPLPFKPPVPDPLPPAPLLSPQVALGLGLLAAGSAALGALGSVWSQIWGSYRPSPTGVLPGEQMPEGPREVTGYMECARTLNGASAGNYFGGIRKVTGITHKEKLYHDGTHYYFEHTVSYLDINGASRVGTAYTDFVRNDFSSFVVKSGTVVTPGPKRPVLWPSQTPQLGLAAIGPFPFPIGRPDPFAPLDPIPEAEPVEQPQAPASPDAPGRTPLPVALVILAPVRLPLAASAPVATNNGQVVKPKPAPVPVTNPGAVFPIPGQPGIPGNGPQPNLPEMAKELGRIERKLEGLLNPQGPEVNPVPNWLEDLAKIWEVLSALQGGGKYSLVEPCDPDGDGQFVKREVEFRGAIGMLGLLSNKLDALAQLQQAAKDLRQPTCPRPRPTGQLVTVNFISPTKPPGSSAYLRKQLRYRDNAGRAEAEHVAHWEQFEWDAGPAIVTSKGAQWGVVQVWAADQVEGRRVIEHAAAIAGVNLRSPEHVWEDSVSRSARYGRSGRMAVERDSDGTACVSKRVGASGQPAWALDP